MPLALELLNCLALRKLLFINILSPSAFFLKCLIQCESKLIWISLQTELLMRREDILWFNIEREKLKDRAGERKEFCNTPTTFFLPIQMLRANHAWGQRAALYRLGSGALNTDKSNRDVHMKPQHPSSSFRMEIFQPHSHHRPIYAKAEAWETKSSNDISRPHSHSESQQDKEMKSGWQKTPPQQTKLRLFHLRSTCELPKPGQHHPPLRRWDVKSSESLIDNEFMFTVPLNWGKWVFLLALEQQGRSLSGCYATVACTGLITPPDCSSEQSLGNEAFTCSWQCLWRLSAGFPCTNVTVTAATRCPLQPQMSPKLDRGNTQWIAVGRMGEEWQNAWHRKPASKMEGSIQNGGLQMMNRWLYRWSQASSGAHWPMGHNTHITPQLPVRQQVQEVLSWNMFDGNYLTQHI